MNELLRPALNCEITNVLASGKNGNRLWMRANPAQGTIVHTVADYEGRMVCDTLSVERAVDAYNDLGEEGVS